MPLSPLSPIADLAPVRHQDRNDRSSARDDKFVVPGAEPEKTRARPVDQVAVTPPSTLPSDPVRRVEPVSPIKPSNGDTATKTTPETPPATQGQASDPAVAVENIAIAPDTSGLAPSATPPASANASAQAQNTAATAGAVAVAQPAAAQAQAAATPKPGSGNASVQTPAPAATTPAGQASIAQTTGLPQTAIVAPNGRPAQTGAAGQAAPVEDSSSPISTLSGGKTATNPQTSGTANTSTTPYLGDTATATQQTGGGNTPAASAQTAALQSNMLAAQAMGFTPPPSTAPDALPVSQSFETPGVSQNFHAEMRAALNAPTQAAAYTARGATTAQPAVEQVALQITRAVDQNSDRMTVHLKPAELGKVTIDLEVQPDNRIIAVISAERSETLDLLQRDARSLERALNDAGLKADSGSLEFNMQGDGGAAADDGSSGDSDARIDLPGHMNATAENGSPPPGQPPRLVPEGRIDIQV